MKLDCFNIIPVNSQQDSGLDTSKPLKHRPTDAHTIPRLNQYRRVDPHPLLEVVWDSEKYSVFFNLIINAALKSAKRILNHSGAAMAKLESGGLCLCYSSELSPLLILNAMPGFLQY